MIAIEGKALLKFVSLLKTIKTIKTKTIENAKNSKIFLGDKVKKMIFAVARPQSHQLL